MHLRHRPSAEAALSGASSGPGGVDPRDSLSLSIPVNTTSDTMSAKEGLLLNEGPSSSSPSSSAKGRVTAPLLVCAALGSMGSAQYGYNIGCINLPQNLIKGEFGLSDDPFTFPNVPMIIALFCVGGWVGSAFSPGIVDKLGRRSFLINVQWLFVLGGALNIALGNFKDSQPTAAYATLLVSRVLFGLGSGAASVVVPMYLGEIATADNKGAFGAINQFQIVVWILIGQLLGLGMSTSTLWPWMFALTGIIAAVTLLCSPLLSESPRWLVSKGRLDEARKVLVRLRGYDEADADNEIAEIEEGSNADADDGEAPSVLSLVRDPVLRAPLFVACMLQLSQQFSGINAVFFYSTTFFQAAFPSNPNIGTIGTIAVGAVNVLATAASIPLIERAGRKPLLLWAIGGMLVMALALTGSLIGKQDDTSAAGPLAALSIVFVNLYVCFFEVGLGAIPWSIGGELFPEKPRATAMGACVAPEGTGGRIAHRHRHDPS
jgi:sugar porter (SP) family MFS transporter